jgi:hypothetical protein
MFKETGSQVEYFFKAYSINSIFFVLELIVVKFFGRLVEEKIKKDFACFY